MRLFNIICCDKHIILTSIRQNDDVIFCHIKQDNPYIPSSFIFPDQAFFVYTILNDKFRKTNTFYPSYIGLSVFFVFPFVRNMVKCFMHSVNFWVPSDRNLQTFISWLRTDEIMFKNAVCSIDVTSKITA